jgi:uncharacterized protein (TIGR03435 family)
VFEVASIKISRDPGTVPVCFVPCTGERVTVEGNRVDIRFMSLYQLIVRAYRIKLYQLSGPNWMTSQKFDILTKMPEGVSEERIPEMLQTLLAERFRLSVHRESKERSVYALVVGRNGSKLKASTARADVFVPDALAEELCTHRSARLTWGKTEFGRSGRVHKVPFGSAWVRTQLRRWSF